MKREFYFQSDTSNKFWTIELDGKTLVTNHGRIGSHARETRKDFGSEEEAKREYEKLIKEKLGKGYVEGSIERAPSYEKPNWSEMSMTEDVFWRIIGLFNWKKEGDDDAVLKPAVAALSNMTEGDIERFQDILADKLHAIDTEAHAREIGEDAYNGNDYFSVDQFLYSRCCVVANGQQFFQSVLAHPEQMPKDVEFEAILYLPSAAYETKTGKEFDYTAPTCYETYSNKDGWVGVPVE